MIVGIDASNIRTGGGKKHLENFISKSLSEFKNIKFILVSNSQINSLFDDEKRVICLSNFLLNSNSILSLLSQLFYSKHYFTTNDCDIVFVPGGIFFSKFKPFVSLSQNMLPFDKDERIKFRLLKRLKFSLMRILQINTFKRSKGVIFLTDYAKSIILNQIGEQKSSAVIPHGIKQQVKNKYSNNSDSFEILYISDFLPYKNQFTVTQSVVKLIKEGYNINLTLIGKTDRPQLSLIEKLLNKNKDIKPRIKIKGTLNYSEIPAYLESCSLFLFASSCENLPFIILEAISYGLPVITTNKKPMKDMVNGENVLFESSDVNSIKNVIIDNLNYEKLKEISNHNFINSKNYTWESNVKNTINYLKSCI